MEGETERLKPQYRAQIATQGFTIVHSPLSALKLEA